MVVFVGPGRRSQSAAGRQCVLGTAATAAGHRRVLGTTATMSGRRCVLRSTAGYTQPQLSARRLAVNSARAGKLGRKRCRSATERATAISERLRLTIRSRAAVGGCECSQAILLASYATTWPPAELIFRQPLAWEHCCQPLAPDAVFCCKKGCTDLISSNLATSRLVSEEPSLRP